MVKSKGNKVTSALRVPADLEFPLLGHHVANLIVIGQSPPRVGGSL